MTVVDFRAYVRSFRCVGAVDINPRHCAFFVGEYRNRVCLHMGCRFSYKLGEGVIVCWVEVLVTFIFDLIEFSCKYPNVGMGYDADVMEKVLCNFEFHSCCYIL